MSSRRVFSAAVVSLLLVAALVISAAASSRTTFGITPTSEVQEPFERQQLAMEAAAVSFDEIETYAGRYLDPKTGILYIGLTEEDPVVQQRLLAAFERKERVRFFMTKYSERELEQRQQLLNSYIFSLNEKDRSAMGLVSTGFAPQHNKVKVITETDLSPEQMKLLRQAAGGDYMLFEKGEQHRLMDRQ